MARYKIWLQQGDATGTGPPGLNDPSTGNTLLAIHAPANEAPFTLERSIYAVRLSCTVPLDGSENVPLNWGWWQDLCPQIAVWTGPASAGPFPAVVNDTETKTTFQATDALFGEPPTEGHVIALFGKSVQVSWSCKGGSEGMRSSGSDPALAAHLILGVNAASQLGTAIFDDMYIQWSAEFNFRTLWASSGPFD